MRARMGIGGRRRRARIPGGHRCRARSREAAIYERSRRHSSGADWPPSSTRRENTTGQAARSSPSSRARKRPPPSSSRRPPPSSVRRPSTTSTWRRGVRATRSPTTGALPAEFFLFPYIICRALVFFLEILVNFLYVHFLD